MARRLNRYAWVGVAAFLALTAGAGELESQWSRYVADEPKTLLELQPFRVTRSVAMASRAGESRQVSLTDLNPAIGAWFVITASQDQNATASRFHVENASLGHPLDLRLENTDAISLLGSGGKRCDLAVGPTGDLVKASRTGLPYAPLCGGQLFLRNPVAGRGTSLERMTDFLRDNVWGGDRLIGFVKKEVYRDAFLEQDQHAGTTLQAPPATPDSPAPARIADQSATLALETSHLALDVDTRSRGFRPGAWYPVRGLQGIFFSTLAPEHVDAGILQARAPSVNRLDDAESRALVYMVAFDLADFDLHFVLGTDHPRVGWSGRPPDSSFDPRLPGPDGIEMSAPLVRNGVVSPLDVDRTVAAFAGGFKREHGAFRHGTLALRNHGSHYGFIQEGVIFSKLQPGLATVYALDTGAVDVKTWSSADDALLPHVRYARQNGVPLIEFDAARGIGVPGALVNQWGAGNWSGSAGEDLRTLRAGLCLSKSGGRRFLSYAYFSAATPSAMARVFQAYGCRYAMHLDMNALEHTYFALYVASGKERAVEHLVAGMEAVDRSVRGQLAPRFLSFPDDRDFFYLTRKASP